MYIRLYGFIIAYGGKDPAWPPARRKQRNGMARLEGSRQRYQRKEEDRARKAQAAASLAAGAVARADEAEAVGAEAEAPRCRRCEVLADEQSLRAEIINAARYHLRGARGGGLRALRHAQ